MPERILIIDDDAALAEMLAAFLTSRGFEPLLASNGREGLRTAYQSHPRLVILDLLLPEMDGMQICQRLRDMSDVPIIVLSAKSGEDDVVRCLDIGADDYVRKPFHLKELEGRINALLRRTRSDCSSPTIYDDGTLRIDLDRQQVLRTGQTIHLTPTEARLVKGLLRRKGNVVPHEELLEEVWGPSYADAKASLSLYVRYVREKLEEDPTRPKYIHTKWGVGYWFGPSTNGSR